MEIELDVFSGRPNPQWQLTRVQAREFMRRLKCLAPRQISGPHAEGLGYRGLIVRPNGGPVNGFAEVRLYHGTVIAKGAATVESFNDGQRALELHLLQTARGKVDEAVLQYVERELAQ